MPKAWLEIEFPRPQAVLSWAIIGGGWQCTQAVVWHRVGNQDLGIDVDPVRFYQQRLEKRRGRQPVVGFLTSASLESVSESICAENGIWVRCISTVGMGNAVRIGDHPLRSQDPSRQSVRDASRPGEPDQTRPRREHRPKSYGTINILLQTSIPLSLNASMEALSLATEARTLAVLQSKIPSIYGNRLATGTGTDCIAIASPEAPSTTPYAGKHTLLGHLIGKVTTQSVSEGIQKWKHEQRINLNSYEKETLLNSTR